MDLKGFTPQARQTLSWEWAAIQTPTGSSWNLSLDPGSQDQLPGKHVGPHFNPKSYLTLLLITMESQRLLFVFKGFQSLFMLHLEGAATHQPHIKAQFALLQHKVLAPCLAKLLGLITGSQEKDKLKVISQWQDNGTISCCITLYI